MSDPRDLTPPPPEPMPKASKDRIRAELRAATGEPNPSRGGASEVGGWRRMAPAVAAAAVLGVVGGAFAVAANSNDSGDRSPVPAGSPTTTGSTDTTPTPETISPEPTGPSETPSLLPSEPPVTSISIGTPTGPVTSTLTGPVTELPTTPISLVTSCEHEIKELGRPGLQGATVTAERSVPHGTMYLFETKSAWIVCHDATATPGGVQTEAGLTPTLIQYHLKSDDYQPDADTLEVSENYVADPDGSIAYAYFFAGGRDFDGVQAISYSFPDGHAERATVGENGLWSMDYVVTDTSDLHAYANTSQAPIEVSVHYTAGNEKTLQLRWGFDTCAQLNHGC